MENSRLKRKRRKQRISLFTNIIFCIITLASLTGCIILLLNNYALRNESKEAMAQVSQLEAYQENYVYSQSDLDAYVEEARIDAREEERKLFLDELKAKMSGSSTATAMLRDFFTEELGGAGRSWEEPGDSLDDSIMPVRQE